MTYNDFYDDLMLVRAALEKRGYSLVGYGLSDGIVRVLYQGAHDRAGEIGNLLEASSNVEMLMFVEALEGKDGAAG